LFDQRRIEQMVRHYVRVLETMTESPEQLVGQIQILDEQERRQVLEEWNQTAVEVARGTIAELFETQVRRTPEAVAVEYKGERLSYAELNRRANQLGHYLSGMGVRTETAVGLCMRRG